MTDPILDIRNLTVHFGQIAAVNDVSLTLRRGETLGLVGESGSGKSTASRAILQINRASSGEVRFDGEELVSARGSRLKALRRRMQMVFQDPRSSLDPRMTVGALLEEPLVIFGVGTRASRKTKVAEMLHLVGLDPAVSSRYPHEFSGGQAQRIAIARALILEPELIIADEPVSALDVSIQAQIINLLAKLRAQLNLSMLFIAHDLAVVRHISDRVAVMYLGRVVELADRDRLYAAPAHPYTRALLSAVPVPDPSVEVHRRREILTGEMPSSGRLPSGCAFRSRCPLHKTLGQPEICTTVLPPLLELTPGQSAACHFADQTAAGRIQHGASA
ncbi:ABC transporter ATP-binding protein [Devosia ginsengisoli]|uniref:ATP-binding cassette domain-containing protein n=1 Tax=Devosia ginsengisoli TaxID=400770 RepID=A0A5B8LWP6_9HYPH|nr:oligopeptide/dipeptide ABC transporter ATP-binding protein [Devosia ginsengisoli]QDZ12757.1 ATP-binding cassette domain-containing protein [Devosia ginsengisoli]